MTQDTEQRAYVLASTHAQAELWARKKGLNPRNVVNVNRAERLLGLSPDTEIVVLNVIGPDDAYWKAREEIASRGHPTTHEVT